MTLKKRKVESIKGRQANAAKNPLTTGDSLVTEIENRITVNPKQCGGRPCVRGKRIRVSDVLDLLASGLTHEQIVGELPDLELSDVQACLSFASLRLG